MIVDSVLPLKLPAREEPAPAAAAASAHHFDALQDKVNQLAATVETLSTRLQQSDDAAKPVEHAAVSGQVRCRCLCPELRGQASGITWHLAHTARDRPLLRATVCCRGRWPVTFAG